MKKRLLSWLLCAAMVIGLLPSMVDALIHSGALTVETLSTDAVWFGMTYREDRETVAQALRELHARGVYPPSLRA